MLSEVTVTFNLQDTIGDLYDVRRTKVWVSNNIETDTVIDTESGTVRLGTGNVQVDDLGNVSVTVWAPGPTSNPSSWQTYINVDYPDRNVPNGRKTRTFGPYTIDESKPLAEYEDEQAVPPTYLSQVTEMLDGYVADVAAAKDDVILAQEAAQTASGDAQAAEESARDVLASVIAAAGPTPGLMLDTDGVPYFDPDDPEPPDPGLTLLPDTDNVPYFAGA